MIRRSSWYWNALDNGQLCRYEINLFVIEPGLMIKLISFEIFFNIYLIWSFRRVMRIKKNWSSRVHFKIIEDRLITGVVDNSCVL